MDPETVNPWVLTSHLDLTLARLLLHGLLICVRPDTDAVATQHPTMLHLADDTSTRDYTT